MHDRWGVFKITSSEMFIPLFVSIYRHDYHDYDAQKKSQCAGYGNGTGFATNARVIHQCGL